MHSTTFQNKRKFLKQKKVIIFYPNYIAFLNKFSNFRNEIK